MEPTPPTSSAEPVSASDPPAGDAAEHRGHRLPRPSRRATAVLVGLLALVALVVGGQLVSRAGFDRGLAIDRAIDDSGGRLTRDQAACYVDRARTQVGGKYLVAHADIPVAVGAKLTAIRDDCVGLANLGAGSAPSTNPSVPATEAGSLPLRHGQDPALDALWARCAAGYGAACDTLFDRAPVGSQYEAFALTCGGRTEELVCAARYRAPGTTTPSPTEVPPTSAPLHP
jgi:hypothetical protein